MKTSPKRVELTRAKIAAIKPPQRGDRIVYDTKYPSLGVRVTSYGHKSYVLYRRVGGKPRRLLVVKVSNDHTVEEVRAIARWMGDGIDSGLAPAAARRVVTLAHDLHKRPEHAMPEVDARRVAGLVVEAEQDGIAEGEARTWALRINAMVADGLTVTEAKRRLAEERGRANRETLDAVFARYMEQHARPKKRSWRDDQRLYDRNLQEVLGHVVFEDIDVDMVRTMHRRVGQRAPVQANRTLALLSRVFSYPPGQGRGEPVPGR